MSTTKKNDLAFQYWNVSGKIILSESAPGAKRIAKAIHRMKGTLRARLATPDEISEYTARQSAARAAYEGKAKERLQEAAPLMLVTLQRIYADNRDDDLFSKRGLTAALASAAIAGAGPSGMTQAQRKEMIAILARELRRNIAQWASQANACEREALGEELVPISYDMEELRSGNYDPAAVLGADEQTSRS